jgi:hypothetical protein
MAHALISGSDIKGGQLELLIGLPGATDRGMGLQSGESVRSAAARGRLARPVLAAASAFHSSPDQE